jgi:DNA-nicking Smr family endonuclease
VKINSLADLKSVKKEIEAQAQRAAVLAAQKALEAKRKAAASNLFQAAIGKVQAMAPPKRAELTIERPKPIPKQHMLDEAAALQEAISDEVDITTLLDTDESLSFRRPGVGMDVVHKLRRGQWSIQRQVDLHGLRTEEARSALTTFVRDAQRQGIRCVRVVTGKGLGSPGKTPVLKDKVHRWLVQKNEIVAFVQAPPAQGGAGALVVLLQPLKSS